MRAVAALAAALHATKRTQSAAPAPANGGSKWVEAGRGELLR